MKKIYISRMTIFSLFIFLLSICGIATCIIKINAYHHAQPLTYFSEGSLKPGKYVSGTITSYVISPRKPKGTDVYDYFGNWNNYIDRYIGYIIPFNEEQYIRIWINDQESLALLNKTQDGLHVNVPFIGQIEAGDGASLYTDDQLGFNHDKVITNYVIVQKSLNTEMFWIKAGLSGIVISLLLYWFKGRIEVSEAVNEDKNSQSIPCYANISDEIAIVQKHISMYEKLEKEYRKGSCFGAVCVVTGVFLFVKFDSFPALMTAILLIGCGISKLWMHFINSENRLAVCIANLLDLRTLQIQRMEDYKLLAELQAKQKSREEV